MRTSRTLLVVLSVALVAACSSEPVGVARPDEKPALGVGFVGTGNAVAGDTTTATSRGVGFVGTGN